MVRQVRTPGVPAADVEETMQDARDSHATFVEKIPEGNPPPDPVVTYTVIATFDD
jgi:hypothetical protein